MQTHLLIFIEKKSTWLPDKQNRYHKLNDTIKPKYTPDFILERKQTSR